MVSEQNFWQRIGLALGILHQCGCCNLLAWSHEQFCSAECASDYLK